MREILEKKIGRKISNSEWDAVVRSDLLNDFESNEIDLVDFGLRALAIIKNEKSARKGKVLSSDKPASNDFEALCRLVATFAEMNEKEVKDFRREILCEKLLEFDEIKPWIEEKAKLDGKRTRWLKIPLPPDVHLVYSESGGFKIEPCITECKEIEVSLEILEYPVWMDKELMEKLGMKRRQVVRRVEPVRLGGVLERLRSLSKKLAANYGWREVDATRFVLCGDIPSLKSRRLSITGGQLSSLLLLKLEVDPMMTTEEVGRLFAGAKEKILPRTIRGPFTKKLMLAEFLLKRPKEESWAKRMEEWNKKCRDWKRADWQQKHRSGFHREGTSVLNWVKETFNSWSSIISGAENG